MRKRPGKKIWVPIYTAARSVLVDKDWNVNNGGLVMEDGGSATEADGDHLQVAGRGKMRLVIWGDEFMVDVRVMERLPDRIVIGRAFWREHKLVMNLALNIGSIYSRGRRITGPISESNSIVEAEEDVRQVVEDEDVDDFIQRELDLSSFLRIDWSVTVCRNYFGTAELYLREWDASKASNIASI